MQATDQVIFTLRYPDGWEETWAVNPHATRESMVTLGLQMLELAGVSYSIGVDIRPAPSSEEAKQKPALDDTPPTETAPQADPVADAQADAQADPKPRRHRPSRSAQSEQSDDTPPTAA